MQPKLPHPNCVKTPGWKFVKKNGKEKGCKWFAKKKQRCNKKPGEMENCPKLCNVCENSGVQLCEDRELRKKICKSVSCCTWDRDSKSCKSNVGQSKCFYLTSNAPFFIHFCVLEWNSTISKTVLVGGSIVQVRFKWASN